MSNWIRAARKRKGLTIRGAARILSVSPTTVLKWERGQSFPGPDKWPGLQEVFGLGPAYIQDVAITHYTKRVRTYVRFRAQVVKKGDHRGKASARKA